MRQKERPEITTRDLDEVCPRLGELGFTSYTLFDVIKAGWCIEATEPKDIPEKAHWTILVQDSVSVSDGYGSSTQKNIWKIYIFDERSLWEQVVQAYYDDANDQSSPTHKRYGGGPMKLIALEASGKVLPHVTVALAMTPRG